MINRRSKFCDEIMEVVGEQVIENHNVTEGSWLLIDPILDLINTSDLNEPINEFENISNDLEEALNKMTHDSVQDFMIRKLTFIMSTLIFTTGTLITEQIKLGKFLKEGGRHPTIEELSFLRDLQDAINELINFYDTTDQLRIFCDKSTSHAGMN